MKYKQTKKTNHTENPASKKHLGLRAFSLGFLAVFVLTIVFGLLISGSSVALFTANSNTITMNFSAQEASEPSLQENLDYLITQVIASNELKKSNHQYSTSNQNPQDAWSRRIEDYLNRNTPDGNIFGFQNPVSGRQRVVNMNTLDLVETHRNPAVFIANGDNFNYYNIPNPPLSGNDENYSRLWGSMIIYKSHGPKANIYYFAIDENGVKGELKDFSFELAQK